MSASSRLIVIGAGGHGCVVAESADTLGCWEEIIFLDDVRQEPALPSDHAVLGRCSDLKELLRPGDEVIIAVGDNMMRVAFADQLRADGVKIATVISAFASVSPTAQIGSGSVVMAGAVMNAGCVLGPDCILNTAATIDHGVQLGRGVHLSPGVHVGGDVQIGDHSWIGIGASITHGRSIGADVSVGAGAVVIDDLVESGTYIGIPATQLDR
jgi:sugar O-acyltransferase (sialic acid O-acetyltransferase NeuD family)